MMPTWSRSRFRRAEHKSPKSMNCWITSLPEIDKLATKGPWAKGSPRVAMLIMVLVRLLVQRDKQIGRIPVLN